MNILLITFDLGVTSSGISTDRVAGELARCGHDVRVVMAMERRQDRAYRVFKASPFPLKPARFFAFVGNLIGYDLNYFFWERRAIKLGLSLIAESRPDVIYGRGSPACAFTVGVELSKKTGIPLAIHFADPIPATPDWQPTPVVRNKMLRTVLPALRHATLVSFVNRRMQDYQSRTTGLCIEGKSIVLQNPIPEAVEFGAPSGERYVFTFLGSFFGSRKPDALLRAFARVAERHSNVYMHIYGVWTADMTRIINADRTLVDRVKVFGWTSDVGAVFKESSCLIDVDSDVDDAVYTSNKLMEYLSVDRPILSITPVNSAARELIGNLKRSCVVTTHRQSDIEESMEKLIGSPWDSTLFEERGELRRNMSQESICRKLLSRFQESGSRA